MTSISLLQPRFAAERPLFGHTRCTFPEMKGHNMNADVLKGQWHQLKGEVKSRWGKLTDDDLDQASGDVEKLMGRLQERYGYARDQARREVDDFFAQHPVR